MAPARNRGLPVLLSAVLMAFGAGATPFRRIPPTIGAYILREGEVQIGVGIGVVPVRAYLTGSASVAVGVAGWLQVGIGMTYGVQPGLLPSMTYTGGAKLRWTLGGGLDLGVPLGFSFVDREMGTEFGYAQAGLVASARLGGDLTLHAGANLGLSRVGTYAGLYSLVDVDLLPNLKLVGTVGFSPLGVSLSAWLRPLRWLDVELALVPFGLALSGKVYARF